MTSTLFWHGTPADIPSADIRPRPSFFEGIWSSAAPEVAAHYAGMQGWVHGFMPAHRARFLLATGHRDDPTSYAYPDAETWEGVRGWLEGESLDLDAFDCLAPGRIARGSSPPLGPDGQPSWEGILQDLVECDVPTASLLESMGIDGVLQGERAGLALGDRAGDPRDPLHAALMDRLRKAGAEPVLTLGALRADFLVPVCRLRASLVAQAFLAGHGMPRTEVGDLDCWIVAPRPEGLLRLTA